MADEISWNLVALWRLIVCDWSSIFFLCHYSVDYTQTTFLGFYIQVLRKVQNPLHMSFEVSVCLSMTLACHQVYANRVYRFVSITPHVAGNKNSCSNNVWIDYISQIISFYRLFVQKRIQADTIKTIRAALLVVCAGNQPAMRTLFPWHVTKWSCRRWFWMLLKHYGDVIMGTTASQITILTIVYSTVYSGTNIKAPRHWPLCGEFTGHRWIPRTNGQ